MKVSQKVFYVILKTEWSLGVGAKSTAQIYNAFESIYPVLTDFRKGGARQLRALPPAAAPLALPPAPSASEHDALEGGSGLSLDAAARVFGRPTKHGNDNVRDSPLPGKWTVFGMLTRFLGGG